jgi:hypothetical protein
MKKFSQFISEARTQAGAEAQKKGLHHVGRGYYADNSGQVVAKSENGVKLVKVSKQELQGIRQKVAQQTLQQDAPQQQAQQSSGDTTQQGQQSQTTDQPQDQQSGQQEQLPMNTSDKKITITFGRFNPPTVGHEKLLSHVAKSAGDGEYRIYPSHSNDPKKNPLDVDSKVALMQQMFPDHAKNIVNDKEAGRNIFDILASLYNQGYSDVNLVVGADRMKEFGSMTQKYNGKNYNFRNINVSSAGERDPDAEGVEGMSASKLRKAAAENDFETYRSGLPKSVDDKVAQDMFKQLRTAMKIKESCDMWDIAPKLYQKELREEFIGGRIFNVGDVVENLNTGVVGRIISKGSNYVIILDENETVHRNWIKDIHYGPKQLEIGTDAYREYAQRITPFQKIRSFTKTSKQINNSKRGTLQK